MWRLTVVGGRWSATIVERGASVARYGTQGSTLAKRGC
jgi:hypothetical protein